MNNNDPWGDAMGCDGWMMDGWEIVAPLRVDAQARPPLRSRPGTRYQTNTQRQSPPYVMLAMATSWYRKRTVAISVAG
jgi:hypothetical protein